MTGPLVVRRFAAGMSTAPDPGIAVGEVVGSVIEQLDGHRPHLAVVFLSGTHVDVIADIVNVVAQTVDPDLLLAVNAGGVIGGGKEVESGTAVSLWAGTTGTVRALRLEALDARADSKVLGVPDAIVAGSTMLLFADPFSFPASALIDQVPHDVAIVGGLASAAASPGGNEFWVAERSSSVQRFTDGAIGVLFPPEVARVVVSQGCRPVGAAWVVTAARGNLVLELGGRPAFDRLQDTIAAMSPEDKAAASQGLHIGLVANERTESPGPGDVLVRTVFGVEQETQGIAIGGSVEVGQLVQFQVRDPNSAAADLEQLMAQVDGEAEGALVFTCNGRGARLFGEPNCDAAAVSEVVPGGVAGMFCVGELGPIGSTNALHGFTATIVTFGELR